MKEFEPFSNLSEKIFFMIINRSIVLIMNLIHNWYFGHEWEAKASSLPLGQCLFSDTVTSMALTLTSLPECLPWRRDLAFVCRVVADGNGLETRDGCDCAAWRNPKCTVLTAVRIFRTALLMAEYLKKLCCFRKWLLCSHVLAARSPQGEKASLQQHTYQHDYQYCRRWMGGNGRYRSKMVRKFVTPGLQFHISRWCCPHHRTMLVMQRSNIKLSSSCIES